MIYKQSVLVALSAVLHASTTEAFVLAPTSQRLSSTLNLLPDEADQLVAAYNAISLAKEEEQSAPVAPIQVNKDAHQNWGASTIAASKSFLTRVFQTPSVLHPQDDVCYYPMVGFRFYEGTDTPLPTKTSGYCPMPTKSQREEEVYGFFSVSNNLEFLYSQDVCLSTNPMDCATQPAAYFNLKEYENN